VLRNPGNLLKICEIGGICGSNFGIWVHCSFSAWRSTVTGTARLAAGNFTTEAQRTDSFSFELCVLCVSVVKMSSCPRLDHSDKVFPLLALFF